MLCNYAKCVLSTCYAFSYDSILSTDHFFILQVKYVRERKKCPVCHITRLHLPAHMRSKHNWDDENARKVNILNNSRKKYVWQDASVPVLRKQSNQPHCGNRMKMLENRLKK